MFETVLSHWHTLQKMQQKPTTTRDKLYSQFVMLFSFFFVCVLRVVVILPIFIWYSNKVKRLVFHFINSLDDKNEKQTFMVIFGFFARKVVKSRTQHNDDVDEFMDKKPPGRSVWQNVFYKNNSYRSKNIKKCNWKIMRNIRAKSQIPWIQFMVSIRFDSDNAFVYILRIRSNLAATLELNKFSKRFWSCTLLQIIISLSLCSSLFRFNRSWYGCRCAWFPIAISFFAPIKGANLLNIHFCHMKS